MAAASLGTATGNGMEIKTEGHGSTALGVDLGATESADKCIREPTNRVNVKKNGHCLIGDGYRKFDSECCIEGLSGNGGYGIDIKSEGHGSTALGDDLGLLESAYKCITEPTNRYNVEPRNETCHR